MKSKRVYLCIIEETAPPYRRGRVVCLCGNREPYNFDAARSG